MNEFDKTLRKKISITPGRRFDNQFWAAFNDEFKRGKKSIWTWQFRSVLATVFIVLGLTFFLQRQSHHSETMLAAEVMTHKDLIADLPLFLTFEKLPSSEKEWAILLPQESARE